jgi:hypothetical protein
MYPDPRFSNPQEHRDALRGSYGDPTAPEHSGCLTLWVVVQALFTGFAAITFLGILGQFSRIRSTGLMVFVLILGVIIAGWIVSLIGIWRWKRWGVYGAVTISIISPISEFIFATPSFTMLDCFQPIIGNAILYYLIHNQWDHFT